MWTMLSDFVGGKIRLVVEYLLIAAVVAISGVTAVLWMQNGHMAARIDTMDAQLGEYRREVMHLKELRTADNKSLTALLTDMKAIAEHDTATRIRLGELEQSNENVRFFLETRLPLELVCLLDDTCARDPSFPRHPAGRPD